MPNTFGKRLADAMAAANMTGADIGRLCEVRRGTVSKWLKMREANLAAKHAACIADATGADLRQLILGDGMKKRSRRRFIRMFPTGLRNRAKFPAWNPRP